MSRLSAMDNTASYVSDQMGGLSYLKFLDELLEKVCTVVLASTTSQSSFRGGGNGGVRDCCWAYAEKLWRLLHLNQEDCMKAVNSSLRSPSQDLFNMGSRDLDQARAGVIQNN